jgi:hypothetical protein
MSESTWAPTPLTDTYQTIQKMVAGYVLMPTDEEVLETAAAGIRRAIDRLNTRTWNWALHDSALTFAAGTRDYALDTSFKAARNLLLYNASLVEVGRLSFLPWGTFLKETSGGNTGGSPCYYSGANPNVNGIIYLDASPGASWVAMYPTGVLTYYARVPYPSSSGTLVDVPSEVVGFIQASAEGFTADRYATAKAAPAYARAERFLHELIVDDCHGQQTDWE